MNQLIKTIACCVLVIQLQAQQKSSISSNTKNTPNTPNTRNTPTNWQAYKKTSAQSAQQLALNKTALLLDKADELILARKSSDQIGMQHYRYQQTYKGILVEGAVYLMHEKAGKVELSNGQIVSGLNINTKPSIDLKQARRLAIDHIGATQYTSFNDAGSKKHTIFCAQEYKPKGSLVIVDPQFSQNATNYRLAYKFEIFSEQPLVRKDVYVDAHNGVIILALEKLHACTSVKASGTTQYAGEVDFRACLQTYGVVTMEHNYSNGKLSVRDFSNVRLPVAEPDFYFDQNLAANEVHYFTQKTIEYFNEKHNRGQDYMREDSMTTSIVNYVKNNMDPNNSYYVDGIGLYYGAGDGVKYSSLSSADMVGHELAHGLTKFEAGLIYKGESGALNESFSDIFGEMVEDYCKALKDTTDGNDWIIGADYTILPDKNGSRSMLNPKDNAMLYELPNTYKGDNWINSPNDANGVHFNSGVQNYWFYLLCEGNETVLTNDLGHQYQIDGIGKTKAAQIAYYNLCNYLTPTSNYIDARLGSIEAAKILFPNEPDVVEQTEAAWDAVGVYKDCQQLDQETLQTLLSKGIANNNWYTDNYENWEGLEIDENGCLTSLSIIKDESPKVENEIPEEIANLTHLKKLELQNLNLTGKIPYAIANLDNLDTLNLSHNKLCGSILPEITYLNQLKHLDVSNNKLSGCFDKQLLKMCHQLYTPVNEQYINEGNNFEIGWRGFCDYKGSCTPCRITDSLTLTKVYKALNGESWTQGWDFNQSVTKWHGVSLDENDCVEGLDLQNNNLTGRMTALLGDLASLHYLYLQDNHLEGSIPYELININNIIDINLSNNNLSGCYNTNLNELNTKWDNAFICNNKISDGNYFNASWCDFYNSGAGNCDNYLEMNCRKRDSLSLRVIHQTTDGFNWKNKWDLNQPIDQWHGVTLNNNGCVTQLKLHYNYLDGFIPNQVGYLTALKRLSFTGNKLKGGIPESLGLLYWVYELKLNVNQLTGNIPASLSNINSLVYFYAGENQLSGEIPAELSKLRKLKILSLHNNQLSGTIPVEFEDLANLTSLSLSENNLSGNIPAELGNLPKLKTLSVDQNNLTGNIPGNIANLSNLTTLKINDNNLSGCYAPNLSALCHQLSTSLISEDNNFEEQWDVFCNNGDGFCDDPVWPGDFNNDGLVNYNDMLYWGLAEGEEDGPKRPLGNIDWAAQNSTTWNEFIANIDVKHQDANGDGRIDENDLAAFKQNYGKIADDFGNLTLQNGEIEFELKLSEYNASLLKFDITVTSNVADSIDVHGFSCSLNFSDFTLDTIFLDNSNSAFPYDQSETFYDKGRGIFDISLTKTNQRNTRIANGSIVQGIVICLPIVDIQGGDPPSMKLEGGGILDAKSNYSSIGESAIYAYDPVGFDEGGLPFNNLPITVTAKHEHCNGLGAACANVVENYGVPPFKYLWSTGETSAEIKNLMSGKYTVTVSDAIGKTNTRTIQVDGQIPAYYSDGTTKCESDCAEYLSLPVHVSSGIYQAGKQILFNGNIHKNQTVNFIAGESIELGNGTSIEQLSINIQNCQD